MIVFSYTYHSSHQNVNFVSRFYSSVVLPYSVFRSNYWTEEFSEYLELHPSTFLGKLQETVIQRDQRTSDKAVGEGRGQTITKRILKNSNCI